MLQNTNLKVIAKRIAWAAQRLFVPPADITERNIYYLYVEIVFASILSAAAAFNSAYVLRLGGSNSLVGLLSSLPALIAIFTYLPSARILEKQSDRMPWVVWSLFFARFGYFILPFLPLVLSHHLAEVTVAVLVAMNFPSVLFSTAWNPLLADAIPPRSRATVLAWRSILSSATIAPLVFLAGRWLDSAAFPVNYQWLYLVGFLGGCGSTYLISRIRLRPEAQHTPPDRTSQEGASWWRGLSGLFGRGSGFTRLVVNTLFFNLGAWMIGPLFMIFYVRQLGATDGWVGTLTTLAHIGVIVGYMFWQRIIHRVGDSRSLVIAAPLVCLHPLLVALVPNLSFILGLEFAINVIAPGVNLSHSMMFLELLPEGKKYTATAVYSMIMNIGAFVGPLVGVALSDRIGIPTTLMIGAGMRLVGAVLFYLFPVKPWHQSESVA